MVATCSDSDSSGSESKYEEITNLYLTARESLVENHESEEVCFKANNSL